MPENPEQITYFAKTNARGQEVPFGIRREDRVRHMYIIGKTGMGKSTLLENMAIQDIRNGEGIAFIDPHGSTADRILEYVPEHRKKDVVYFAPFDMEYPLAFNVMEDVGYDKRHLVVSGLLAAFRKIWVDAWSARMEYILSNTLLALLEYPGSTLLDVNRLLINKNFRKKVVENVKDPIVRSFWVDEFATYTDRYTQEATPAIQNKIGQFTSNPLIRNIVGQPVSSFDIRRLMDEKKILIMNLSKGRVGEVNATLLGSMLVTKIYLAAMSRADVSAEVMNRLPSFYFYVDEFQNFANESFSDILSEARKYKLNLIIAHQYIEQMEEEVRDAVFGNVGTTVAFRVGPFDAEVLETIFNPQFTATDLVNLGFAQIYLTLMINRVGSPPFSATTLPPFDPPPEMHVEEVLRMSRTTFGRPRAEVEKLIQEWQGSEPPNLEQPKKRPPAARSYSRSVDIPQPSQSVSPPPAPPPPPPEEPPVSRPAPVHRPAHQVDAKTLGEHLAHEHTLAQSKAKEPVEDLPPPLPQHIRPVRQDHPPRPPYKPPVKPERPPLEGPKTLKEALEAAYKKPQPTEVAPEPTAPAAATSIPGVNLKEILAKVVTPPPQSEKKSEIPEAVLRDMLAVDEEIT